MWITGSWADGVVRSCVQGPLGSCGYQTIRPTVVGLGLCRVRLKRVVYVMDADVGDEAILTVVHVEVNLF